MTPDTFRDIIRALALTHADAARVLGVSRPAITAWAQGRNPIPGPVAKLLRLLEHGIVTPGVLAHAE